MAYFLQEGQATLTTQTLTQKVYQVLQCLKLEGNSIQTITIKPTPQFPKFNKA